MERELCEEKGLPRSTVDKIGTYVQLTGGAELVDRLESDARLMEQESAKVALADIRLLLSYCDSLGILDRVRFDLSLARGLDYYTGVIYEAVLTGRSHSIAVLQTVLRFPHIVFNLCTVVLNNKGFLVEVFARFWTI